MIRLHGITHFVGEKDLYTDLNWHIKPGERIALIGDNGTGKTTLLRMIVGEQEPIKGQVSITKYTRIGFLRQEIHSVTDERTVLQEVLKAYEQEQANAKELLELYDRLAEEDEKGREGLYDRIFDLEKHVTHHNPGEAEADARKILTGLGFTAEEQDAPLARFSGGWQMRAHIGRLLLESPDVLILDEPTNHLDLESIDWLEKFLENFPGALVVVSHDRYFLDRVTNRTAWIHEKRLDTYSKNYSGFLKEREEYEDLLLRRYQNQQEELAHHQKFIERFRSKASKATLVQSRIKMVDKIERIELPTSAQKVKLRIPEPAPCGRNVMELRDIAKAYGTNQVFTNANLRLEQGDRVALVGRNGAGKSTLLKICAGVLDHEGVREVHPKARLEYFSQNRIDSLNLDNEVLTEARPEGAQQTDEQIRSLLGCFLFKGDDVFKPVKVLSGGEKSRLALARMMLRKGNVLLLDEPTNHLDISTRTVLQQALAEFPGTIVLISHDRYFIDAVANRIVEVGNGTAIAHYGNYSEFLRNKQESGSGEAHLRGRATATVTPSPLSTPEPAASVKAPSTPEPALNPNSGLSKKEKAVKRNALYTEFRELEKAIEQGEKRLEEIHALQADPEAYTKGTITAQVSAEGRRLEGEIPKLVERWEELGVEIEGLK